MVTYTYAILEVSAAAYKEIADKLRAADYRQVFHADNEHGTVIDMHGIALACDTCVAERHGRRIMATTEQTVPAPQRVVPNYGPGDHVRRPNGDRYLVLSLVIDAGYALVTATPDGFDERVSTVEAFRIETLTKIE